MDPYSTVFKSCLEVTENRRPNFAKIRSDLEGFRLSSTFEIDEAEWARRKERWLRQAYQFDLRIAFNGNGELSNG